MAWLYLLAAGVMEVGWPLGLKKGFDPVTGQAKPLPLLVAAGAMLISGILLYLAQRTIPMGTAYAVWTGIGSVGALALGIALFGEPANAPRIACAGLIVAGVVGLKLFAPE